jgi:acid phosphatase type 7
MKRPISLGWFCLFVAGPSGLFTGIHAAELRRGPFLQIATQDGITIRWRTDVACESVVRYGTKMNVLTSAASDANSTTEHEVRLTGLASSTQYFYSIGSRRETLAVGADCNFITFPGPGRQAQPTRVWVIGDPGQSPELNQRFVRDAYKRYAGSRHTDVWLALGDNCLCWGTDEEYQTYFFDVYDEMLRQTALWPTIGNHETWGGVSPSGQIPYLDIFSLPTNGAAGGVASAVEEYYSFDYANIHFICLDSMTQSRATNGPMANWLRADLTATTNQWIIAYWHHPPYTCGSHWSDNPYEPEMFEMRQNIVPILEAGGVDLVLCGHGHIYERSYLLHGHYGFSATLQPSMILDPGSGRENDTGAYIKPTSGPLANRGTVYVEVGCSASVDEQCCRHPVMSYCELQLGSLVLDINSRRLDAVFLRDTGAIHDSFTILKGEPAPLRLLNLILNKGNTILQWKSIPGQTYRIERTANLQGSGWQPASDTITAVGFTTSWTNLTRSGPIYLFRVVQLPPPDPPQGTTEVRRATSAGLTGWRTQELSFLTARDVRLPDPMPKSPEGRLPLAGAWGNDAVICNTTYWRRKIKPQPQQSGPRWRLANTPSNGVWRQLTLHG